MPREKDVRNRVLSVDRLCVGYRTKKANIPVVRDLSFCMESERVLAILGPSGCGKSTLIGSLAGTVPIKSGTMTVFENGNPEPLSPKTHRIGVIPQNLGLLPWKTVRDNCLLPLRLRREPVTEERRKEIREIWQALDLMPLLDRYPTQLSGGQAQRAAVARAFILRPDLLLMDEPFSALDEITRQDARELFLSLWKRRPAVAILVTHSIEEALYLGHSVFVMGKREGKILLKTENPFFGVSDPRQPEYRQIRRLLRGRLRPDEEEDE
ncbi:ABC transporter ATP-binding protein [Caproicibacter fermentans]|uniref:ABC transporter ATP-binding protein n=1 Tax=Caproicibacter fermentans TaxID=2576756 RepID=UPI0012EEA2C0|nr:ATP-binding cassette domain-containing protein [Caproicibacter fermentans]